MSSSALPQPEVKKWRIIVFVVVAGLLVLLTWFAGFRDLLLLPGQSGFPSEIHRWHEAQSGAFTALLFGGSFLVLLWQPLRKPLLALFIVLSIVLVSISFATVSGYGFNPIMLAIGAVLASIIVIAYPMPRALLNFRREGALSYPLLILTLVAAVLLAPIIARELNWQILGITDQDVHALNYHWLTSVVLALMLILAGSLAATKQAGWLALGLITGVTYLYLGGMAVLLPDYAGSWGVIGGVLGLLGGVAYITVTLLEARKGRRVVMPRTARGASKVLP
ncbi:MAG TPA: hypothetical protein VJ761_22255 [Ktedonobacteraceae bacterium]|nr:hypothetical protein [Ktedonobacteraceae bacterium]